MCSLVLQINDTTKLRSCFDGAWGTSCLLLLLEQMISSFLCTLEFPLAQVFTRVSLMRRWSYLRLWNNASVVQRQQRAGVLSLSGHIWVKRPGYPVVSRHVGGCLETLAAASSYQNRKQLFFFRSGKADVFRPRCFISWWFFPANTRRQDWLRLAVKRVFGFGKKGLNTCN